MRSTHSKGRHRDSTAQPKYQSGWAWRSAATAGRACRMSPIAPSRTIRTRGCSACCDNKVFSHKVEGGLLVFEFNSQLCSRDWSDRVQASPHGEVQLYFILGGDNKAIAAATPATLCRRL